MAKGDIDYKVDLSSTQNSTITLRTQKTILVYIERTAETAVNLLSSDGVQYVWFAPDQNYHNQSKTPNTGSSGCGIVRMCDCMRAKVFIDGTMNDS